jgi:hypothetical protein
MTTIFDQLKAPFPPDRISWRVGATNKDKTKGMALAYIDSRDVQDRFDAACGPGGWQCRYPHANTKTVCEIGVKVGDEWIWKADGAGDSDVEAEKGALSDAFKRAAVKWGVGRYLYDVASPWIEIEAYGKSYKIKDGEYAKLTATLGKSAPKPSPAKPAVAGLPELTNAALDMMDMIDQCDTAKALDNYATTTLSTAITKLPATDADLVRTRFGQRKKALKSAEHLAA